MSDAPPPEVTNLLETFRGTGDLFASAYDDLRRIAAALMAGEAPGQTLEATALVNEAYIRLVGGADVDWADRHHFVRTVARSMRHVLIDRARSKKAVRHGGELTRVEASDVATGGAAAFPVDRYEDLEAALGELEDANERWGEIVLLRFYAGLSVAQTADLIGISESLVKQDWRFARLWLANRLG